MAKIISKREMVALMDKLYKNDRFDMAVNKAKKDYFITVLNRQGKKKYLVNNNLA